MPITTQSSSAEAELAQKVVREQGFRAIFGVQRDASLDNEGPLARCLRELRLPTSENLKRLGP